MMTASCQLHRQGKEQHEWPDSVWLNQAYNGGSSQRQRFPNGNRKCCNFSVLKAFNTTSYSVVKNYSLLSNRSASSFHIFCMIWSSASRKLILIYISESDRRKRLSSLRITAVESVYLHKYKENLSPWKHNLP